MLLSMKYQVLPLESSSLVDARRRSAKFLRLCPSDALVVSRFEIMRPTLDCRAWLFFAEKVSKWKGVRARHNVIVRVVQSPLITSTLTGDIFDWVSFLSLSTRTGLRHLFFQDDKRHGYFHVCDRSGPHTDANTYKEAKRGRRADPFRNNSKRKTSRIDNWHHETERSRERGGKRHAWQEEMRALAHLMKSMNGNDDEWESGVQERERERGKEEVSSFLLVVFSPPSNSYST